MLKDPGARARRKELRHTSGHLKPWQEISLGNVAKELVFVILDIIQDRGHGTGPVVLS